MMLSPLPAAVDNSVPAPMPPGGNSVAASAFDAILALETLAAAATPVDAAALEGLTVPEEVEFDDDDDDIEDLLAFLTTLMNTPVLPQGPMTARPGGDMTGAEVAVDASGAQVGGNAGGDAAEPAPVAGRVPAELPSLSQAVTPDKPGAAQALANPILEPVPAPGGEVAVESASSRGIEWVAPAARQAQAAEQARIATPVRDPRWAEEFGTRIALMVRAGESSAALQLSPAELGPLDVSVTVRDSQASIHFGAAQAETRALIEASIPRLREMLAAQGFQLMDASVSQGFARQAQPPNPAATFGNGDAEAAEPATRSTHSLGLLDLYA